MFVLKLSLNRNSHKMTAIHWAREQEQQPNWKPQLNSAQRKKNVFLFKRNQNNSVYFSWCFAFAFWFALAFQFWNFFRWQFLGCKCVYVCVHWNCFYFIKCYIMLLSSIWHSTLFFLLLLFLLMTIIIVQILRNCVCLCRSQATLA